MQLLRLPGSHLTMRPRSSSRRILLIGSGITLMMIVGFFGLRALLGPQIRRVHTEFLFAQIDLEFRPAGGVKSVTELAEHLADQPVDWNSCSLRDGVILDGWEEAIRFTVTDKGGFELVSAGADRSFGTSDDITRHFTP